MTDPIRPEEVAARKLAALPDGVIDSFNELIAKAFDGQSAVVYQNDVIEAILANCCDVTSRQQVFDDHLLDVEPAYRAAGWDVAYDKPGWNETGRAYFTFTRRSERHAPPVPDKV